MKISVNDQELFTLNEIQKKLFKTTFMPIYLMKI